MSLGDQAVTLFVLLVTTVGVLGWIRSHAIARSWPTGDAIHQAEEQAAKERRHTPNVYR